MRIPALLLAALLTITLVPAQTMEITSAHQVRIAYGDIPATTDQVETAGVWNVEQLLLLSEGENGKATIPTGHVLGAPYCREGCDFDLASEQNTLTATCNTGSSNGVCAIAIPHSIAGGINAFGMSVPVADDHSVFVYAPEGIDIRSGTPDLLADLQPFHYPGSDPAVLIHQFRSETSMFWFTASPVTEAPGAFGSSTLVWAGLAGLVVGVALWYVLVSQGVVQKRQRKQVASEAAHRQVAKAEPKATLEWRRRALMAAMKELEVARMDQEIDLDAYDALKADFKRQTVTVMRALEESE